MCCVLIYFFLLGFITLSIQYYSVICRPSDHTVGIPCGLRFEPGPDGLEAGTLPGLDHHTTPHFLAKRQWRGYAKKGNRIQQNFTVSLKSAHSTDLKTLNSLYSALALFTLSLKLLLKPKKIKIHWKD